MLYRSTKYGSPFLNLNAGVDSRDSENQSNMTKIKETFKNSQEGQELKSQYSPIFVNTLRVSLPILGGIVGKFIGDSYCQPKSIYLRGFYTLLFAGILHRVAADIHNYDQVSYWTKNFHLLPVEIQTMLKTHDARYARKWLQ